MPKENPLAGISIPSLTGMVDDVVEQLGRRQIDLSNGLERQRLKQYLVQGIDYAFKFQLEDALHKATDKAVTHVFRVMRDEEYQRKRAEASERRKTGRLQRAAEKEKEAQAERMELQKKRLQSVKAPMIQ